MNATSRIRTRDTGLTARTLATRGTCHVALHHDHVLRERLAGAAKFCSRTVLPRPLGKMLAARNLSTIARGTLKNSQVSVTDGNETFYALQAHQTTLTWRWTIAFEDLRLCCTYRRFCWTEEGQRESLHALLRTIMFIG